MKLKLKDPVIALRAGHAFVLISKSDIERDDPIAQIWSPARSYSKPQSLQEMLKYLYNYIEVPSYPAWDDNIDKGIKPLRSVRILEDR